MMGCGGFELLILLSFLAVPFFGTVWVYRDATARCMELPVAWIIVILIGNVLGLTVYLIVRPKGPLIKCPHCARKRINGSATCPHCSNA